MGWAFLVLINTVRDVFGASTIENQKVPHGAFMEDDKRSKKVRTVHDIGPLIRRVRKRQGLTQQRLADLVGVGARFVSEVERGKPTAEFDKVVDLLRGVGIDIFAVTRGEEL